MPRYCVFWKRRNTHFAKNLRFKHALTFAQRNECAGENFAPMIETFRLLTPVVRVHEGKKPASRWAEYERRSTRRIFAGKEKRSCEDNIKMFLSQTSYEGSYEERIKRCRGPGCDRLSISKSPVDLTP